MALCAPLAHGDAFVEPASSREISEALGVSEAAIKQHLVNLYEKFAIDDGDRRRTRLANKAVAAGLVARDNDGDSDARPVNDALAIARQAATVRNWPRAFENIMRVSREELSADDLELVGEAAIWSGHPDESIAARQRAYALHVQAGQGVRAAIVALKLIINFVVRNQPAQAAGWLAKVRRHLEGSSTGLAHGYLHLMDAVFGMYGGHHAPALASAEQALAIANEAGDEDLRAQTLVVQGYVLSVLGREVEARPMLDEAMASATGGELGPMATGFVYCRTVCASLDTLDYERALEWTSAIERVQADACTYGFPGDCRAHRASIYVMRGDWEVGEREARLAADEAEAGDLRHVGIALNEVGMVRMRMGDLAGAEDAFLRSHSLGGSSEPGLALLRSARGEHAQARSLIATALEQTAQGTATRGKLLAARFEIAMAATDVADAQAARDELAAIASKVPQLGAALSAADGVLMLAQGKTGEACAAFRSSVSAWVRAGAPFEAACTRIQLARALVQASDRSAASLELGIARPVLERLGAKPALAQADAVLASVEQSPSDRPEHGGHLVPRTRR